MATVVAVVDKDGQPLMPTTRLGKVRHMLKDGRAVVFRRNPFTIQLTYEPKTHFTQPVELCVDTGYVHAGLSVKSESKEYVSAQYDLLTDEKQRHDAQRMYRKTRRNRLRHRKPRFLNRRKEKGAARKPSSRRTKYLERRQQKWEKYQARHNPESATEIHPVCEPEQVMDQESPGKVALIAGTFPDEMETVARSLEADSKASASQTAKKGNPCSPNTPKNTKPCLSMPPKPVPGNLPPEEDRNPAWLPPSIRNKAERHVDLAMRYLTVCPVRDIWIEVGEFDTTLIRALAEGLPLPQGEDGQHGERYQMESLRNAVFARDGHRCVFCGRGLHQGAILHTHHALFWKKRHGNSMRELVTCCTNCHTPANHQKGGLLWGYNPSFADYAPCAWMNSVRWYIVSRVKEEIRKAGLQVTVHTTFGAATKAARVKLNLDKSHVNDAYAMGRFHPPIRAGMEHYRKNRRNNRRLEKFFDAKYEDTRDGSVKSGKQLGSNRTNRREPRQSEKNLRKYRGRKKKKGFRQIRKKRSRYPSGTVILWQGKKKVTIGMKNKGAYVIIRGSYNPAKKRYMQKAIAVEKVKVIFLPGGWIPVLDD